MAATLFVVILVGAATHILVIQVRAAAHKCGPAGTGRPEGTLSETGPWKGGVHLRLTIGDISKYMLVPLRPKTPQYAVSAVCTHTYIHTYRKEAGDEHVCPRAIAKINATVCGLRYMGKVNEKKRPMSMCAPEPLAR